MRSILLTFFLMATLLSGCAKKEISENVTAKAEVDIEYDTVLDLCIYNADTLNPLVTSVKHNAEVLSCLYDSLFTVSANFEAEPQLCENFDFSEDGLLFTARLRENIFFQDGTPLTAQDAADSVMRILASDGYYKKRMHGILEAYAENNVLYLRLTEPNKNLCTLLDFPILPGGGAGDRSSVLAAPASGTGLYTLKEFKLNHSIFLTANPNHFSGKMPYFSEICIQMANTREMALSMLENEEIDVLSSDMAEMEYAPKNNIRSVLYPGCRYVFLGARSASLLRNISSYVALENFLPEGAISTNIPVHPFAKRDAERLRFSADTASPLSRSCTLLYCKTVPTRANVAKQIAENCTKAGWLITPVGVTEEVFREKVQKQDYDLHIGETELLPDFSFSPSTHTIGLYFRAERILHTDNLTELPIFTLNPYKSIHEWK